MVEDTGVDGTDPHRTDDRRGDDPDAEAAMSATSPLLGGKIVIAQDALEPPADLYLAAPQRAGAMQLTHANMAALADVPMAEHRYEPFAFTGWNGETRARLCGEALWLEAGDEISHRLPDPRRAARLVRRRLELSLEPAGLGGHGLCGGDGRFPRLVRLWRGVRPSHHRPLGRPAAGGPAEGLGGGAGQISVGRRVAGLRARRLLRRLHGGLDRGELERRRGSAWSTTTASWTPA